MEKPFTLLVLAIVFVITGCTQKSTASNSTTFTFPSKDGLLITADEYKIDEHSAWILLCHQATYSRGEYKQTALWLNQLGYNCLAIDQRSGNECNGVKNETAERAKQRKLPTDYLDAEKDMQAAIDYLHQQHKQAIIVVGSSYSASLALKIAAVDKNVAAVLSFSPGEYFGKALELKPLLHKISCPVFVTSSQAESFGLSDLVAGERFEQFMPKANGVHGSRALWETTDGYEEYREAVKAFLKSLD